MAYYDCTQFNSRPLQSKKEARFPGGGGGLQQAPEASPEAMAEAMFSRNYVRDAISKLKGEKQKVILMRFIDGLSYEEIARALGKKEGAIRVIQYRALNDLRHMLAQNE